MKKLFLITIILLLQSFPSYGSSPNGKGLICKCVECILGTIDWTSYIEEKKYPTEVGYFFKNDKVKYYFIRKKNDKIFMSESFFKGEKEPKPYMSDLNKIEWGKYFGITYLYTLDRETLLLKKRFNEDKSISTIRKCEPYDSFNKFEKKMNELSLTYQKKYDLKLIKNKF